MRKKSFIVLLAVVLLSSMLISCASGTNDESDAAETEEETPTTEATEAEAPASDGILRTGEGPDDKWSASWADYGRIFKTSVFSRLLKVNENMEPVYMDLAEDYEVSDDELTYTFTLRDDVKWHDGEPFTAEDVKWSIEMALKSASINAVFSGAFSKIEGADAWKDGTADELTGVTIEGNKITIQLTEPVGVFLLTMAQWPPYPKHLLEDEDPATLHLSDFWNKPIGNGPYMVTEVEPNNYGILEVFDDYYGEKPKIEKIMVQTMTEDQSVTKAQVNELDYHYDMDISRVNEITKNPNYEAHPVDIIYIRYLMANMMGTDGNGNPKIEDLRVRQALMHAIDRETIAEQLYPEQAVPLHTKVPQGLPEYNDNVVKYDYDPEKAKALLEEADFDFDQTIRLQYYYEDQNTIDLIDTIQYYWEQVGVKVETSLMKGDLLELLYNNRQYDFVYAGLSAMAMEEVYGSFHTDSASFSQVLGGDPDVWDPIIDELRQTSDPEKRMEIIHELQELEADYLWHMPMFSMKQYIIVNKNNLQTAGIYGNEWTNYERKMHEWEMK